MGCGFEEKLLAHDVGVGVMNCKLSPDGKSVVALLSDRGEKCRIVVWDTDRGEQVRTFGMPRLVWGEFTFTDSGRTLAGMTQEREGDRVVSAVLELDAATGEEKRRIELGPQYDPARGEVRGWRAAYTADGKQVVVAGGYWMPEKANDPSDPFNSYRGSGSIWVIERESGKLLKTLIDRRHGVVRSVHRTADGKKMIVQPQMPSRLDRDFGGPSREDEEFVELQQWDVATWERDWTKIVTVQEQWKLLGGAR